MKTVNKNVSAKRVPKKNKVLFWVILFFIFFWTICSFLSIYLTVSKFTENDKSSEYTTFLFSDTESGVSHTESRVIEIESILVPAVFNPVYYTGSWDNSILTIQPVNPPTSKFTLEIGTFPVIKDQVYSVYISNFNYSSNSGTLNYINLAYKKPYIYIADLYDGQLFSFTSTKTGSCSIGLYSELADKQTFAVAVYQADINDTDVKQSIYYEMGKIDGYFNGYNVGEQVGYQNGLKDSIYGLDSIFGGSTASYYYKTTSDSTPINCGTFNLTITGSSVQFNDLIKIVPDVVKEGNIYEDYISISFVDSPSFHPSNLSLLNIPYGTIVTSVGSSGSVDKVTHSFRVLANGAIVSLNPSLYEKLPLDTIDLLLIYGRSYNNSGGQYFGIWNYYGNMLLSNDVAFDYNEAYKQGVKDTEDEKYFSWYLGRYDQGLADGKASNQDYSFLTLIGAVIDAPIKAITGLFNFDLLGFNMSGFFFALVTCALIISVVRLFF